MSKIKNSETPLFDTNSNDESSVNIDMDIDNYAFNQNELGENMNNKKIISNSNSNITYDISVQNKLDKLKMS